MVAIYRNIVNNLHIFNDNVTTKCKTLSKAKLIEICLLLLAAVLFIIILYHFPTIKPIWRRHIDRVSKIRSLIRQYNTEQIIHNTEIYGPVDTDTTVIIIQVHDRLKYLRYLIDSLYRAKEIEKALLIFSHDHYDDKLNHYIQKTDFCKYMQIFYPYSIQTHPKGFPGFEPKDCWKNKALRPFCSRNATLTQIKHHWWWKLNVVFDGLEATQDHQGMVLFLDEDDVVTEDFLHILRRMVTGVTQYCPKCNIFSLSTVTSNFSASDSYTVSILPWDSTKFNVGQAFNRTTWAELKTCSREFCTFNDYHWDNSLQYVSSVCTPLRVMAVRAPRVYHIGVCGISDTPTQCNPTEVLNEFQAKVKQIHHYLFPPVIKAIREHPQQYGVQQMGYWNDSRDHKMCMSLTSKNIQLSEKLP